MFLPLIANPAVILIDLILFGLVLELLAADTLDALLDGAVGHVLGVGGREHQEPQRIHVAVVPLEVETVDCTV